jgi:hypothetical protein
MVYGSSCHIFGNGVLPNKNRKYWPSYFSINWQNQATTAITNLIALLQNMGYSKRVVGFQFTGGHDGQFVFPTVDFSECAFEAYKKYLLRTYGSVSAISKELGTALTSIDDVKLPNFPDGGYPKGDPLFYDPMKDAAFVSYWRFLQYGTFEILENIARIVKKQVGKDVVFARYCMAFNAGDISSTSDITPFLKSDIFNIITPQPTYASRSPGKPVSLYYPTKSFNLHGKMMIWELDIRNYSSPSGIYAPDPFNVGFTSRMEDFAMWQVANRKIIGKLLSQGQGYWYFDIEGGMFEDDQLVSDACSISKIYKNNMTTSNSFKPDVALVYDEDSYFWYSAPNRRWHHTARANGKLLCDQIGLSGVPFDILYLDDLADNRLPEYKIYIFVQAHRIDERKKAIYEALKKNDHYLIWVQAPGYLAEDGKSLASIKELTGISVKYEDSDTRQSIIVADPSLLKKGILPQQSPTYIALYSRSLNDNIKDYLEKHYFTPPKFVIEDNDAKTLAVYADNRAAISVKKMSGWTSVYIGQAGALSAEMLHYFAQEAKAYTLTQPGVEVSMSSSFLSLHCLRAGNYKLTLPLKMKLVNLKDNTATISGYTHQVLLAAQGVYWFKLIPEQ